MTKTERYRMEYVNCEVSTIHDDYEKEELCAEEIVDRLNSLNNENEQLKKDIEKLSEIIDDNIPFGRMLSDRDLNDICNEMGWELSEKGVKLNQLEKENEQLKKKLECITNSLQNQLNNRGL